ncbi:hypothetical protein OAK19_06605 [Aureispira]|nr:hypothetical protein [Aureispira sp.]
MKNLNLILIAMLMIFILSSCGRSPYKKRKGCRGNGSWYGHRNLGAIDKVQKEQHNKYVWISEETDIEEKM